MAATILLNDPSMWSAICSASSGISFATLFRNITCDKRVLVAYRWKEISWRARDICWIRSAGSKLCFPGEHLNCNWYYSLIDDWNLQQQFLWIHRNYSYYIFCLCFLLSGNTVALLHSFFSNLPQEWLESTQTLIMNFRPVTSVATLRIIFRIMGPLMPRLGFVHPVFLKVCIFSSLYSFFLIPFQHAMKLTPLFFCLYRLFIFCSIACLIFLENRHHLQWRHLK